MNRFSLKVRKFHRIISLVLGVQVAFWIISGIYFAWIPIDTVRGRDLTRKDKPEKINVSSLVPLRDLEITQIDQLELVEIRKLGATYKIQHNGLTRYFNATTGQELTQLSDNAIKSIARLDYDGDRQISATTLIISDTPLEYKGPLPVYQVTFDDWRNTRLYLDPISGEIRARRNAFWRLFDFLWMLHILDFGAREDFNNNLLKMTSLASFGIVVSGYTLFFLGRRRKRKQS